MAQERGLSNGTVTAIAQGRNGFLWLGTADGLNRYDGTGFRVYRPIPGDTTSLAHAWITSIAASRTGPLWVATLRGGVHRFIPGSPGLRRYRHLPGDSTSLSSDQVNVVQEARDGALWAGTIRGLDRVDPATGRVTRFRPLPGDTAAIGNDVLALALGDDGAVWIGTRGGPFRLDPSHGEITSVAVPLRTAIVRALVLDRRGVLWIGTEDEVVAFDTRTGAVRARHQSGRPARAPLFDGRVMALHEGPDGTIWIGSDDGLTALDPVRGTATRHRHDRNDSRSLGGTIVRSVLVDRGGVLWAGIENYGVSKHAPSLVQFDLIRHDPSAPNTLSDGYVRGITEDGAGDLWIGTQFGGVNRRDRSTGRLTAYRHEPGNPHSLPGNDVWAVHQDRAGAMWIGLHRQGLGTIDPRTGRFTRFAGVPPEASVNVVFEDRAGAIVVGTEGRGIFEISRDRMHVRTYGTTMGDHRVLVHDDVQTILEDRDGLLWIGGVGGLTRLDRRTGEAKWMRAAPGQPGALPSDFVTNVVQDSRGTVWVATKGGGLSRYDRERDRFVTISTADGLPHDFVYGVLEDARGRLWLSTDDGVAMYDPRNGQITPYGLGDGLQAREFNRRAFFRSPDGTMYFGGINGVNVFRPDDVSAAMPLPPVTLVTMKVGDGAPALVVQHTTDSIVRLRHDENAFTLTFAALEYSAPEKIRFVYRLEGVDRDWVEAGSRREASYSGLQPGRYVFEVKAANAAGAWSPRVAGMTVVIDPPWTGTWWARTLAGLALLGIPIGGMRVRLLAVRRRSALLERRVDEQTKDLRAAQEQLSAALERERDAARELIEITAAVPGAVFQLRESPKGALDFPFVSEGIARLGDERHRAAAADDPCRAAELFLPGVYPQGTNGLARALAASRESAEPWRAEWSWVDAGGATRWTSVQARPFRLGDGATVWTGVLMDTTAGRRAEAERTALERKVLQSQKAESLAVLAGGVAHDFNNLLVGVLAGADLLREEVALSGDAAETVGHIRTAALRAAELTQQMLAYAGKGQFVVEKLDLASLVREMLALVRSAVPRTIAFEFQADGPPAPVQADATQLRQIVLNLVTNASEAIGDGPGRVVVRVGIELRAQRELALLHAAPEMSPRGPYAVLEVTDDGSGMDVALLQRIFDPFYTTKFTGRGLGLAALLGIVRAHRGGLHVTTAPGGGTTFRVYLPLADAPAPDVRVAAPAGTVPGDAGSTRILIVDDEEVVRSATERMVRRLGYAVVGAADGAAALALLESDRAFALILMDVTMPAMDGPATARAIRARGVTVPVVFMSGYAAEELAARGMVSDADAFLKKPFLMADLREALRQALSALSSLGN